MLSKKNKKIKLFRNIASIRFPFMLTVFIPTSKNKQVEIKMYSRKLAIIKYFCKKL